MKRNLIFYHDCVVIGLLNVALDEAVDPVSSRLCRIHHRIFNKDPLLFIVISRSQEWFPLHAAEICCYIIWHMYCWIFAPNNQGVAQHSRHQMGCCSNVTHTRQTDTKFTVLNFCFRSLRKNADNNFVYALKVFRRMGLLTSHAARLWLQLPLPNAHYIAIHTSITGRGWAHGKFLSINTRMRTKAFNFGD